jgi:serine/threonine-protein kinase
MSTLSTTPAPAPGSDDAGDGVGTGTILAGRYRIGERLGEGGMGAVYRAEHLGLKKPVAVKLLHRVFAACDEIGARFQREAFVGGRLDHPNCVTVMDFGVREDGAFFLVMELLRGETLLARLEREQRLPWQRALHIARHVLRGIAHAHAQGVVHRDLKPANIFLEPTDDDPDFAKVLDFGIAKLIAAAAGGDPTLTQAGATLGTPTYLSPEQALGKELDAATDLYSLSVVLFEMITGTPPFLEDDALSQLRAHTTAPIPSFAEVAPEISVPPAVEALVRRGLAKDPRDRVASAAEMIAIIDEIRFSHGHTLARPGTPWPVSADPDTSAFTTVPRRWPRLALAGGAAAVLVIGVAAALLTGDAPASSLPAPRNRAAGATAPATAAVAVPVPVAVPAPPAVDREMLVKAAKHDLESGRTCAARKAAVGRLRELGDPSAIPALRRARVRERGGFLGMGAKNINACLRAEADAAIAHLKTLEPPKPPPSP